MNDIICENCHSKFWEQDDFDDDNWRCSNCGWVQGIGEVNEGDGHEGDGA